MRHLTTASLCLLLVCVFSIAPCAETIKVEVSQSSGYFWGIFPPPPKTIDGPPVKVEVSPIDDIKRATIDIEVWEFKIANVTLSFVGSLTEVSNFDVDFEQVGSVVSIQLDRIDETNVWDKLTVTLHLTYLEPEWQENIKTFGQFRILRTNLEFVEGAEEKIAELHHGSWYVNEDHITNSWSATLYSALDGQPIEGVWVELIGLADTPNLYRYSDTHNFILSTDDKGRMSGFLPKFDPSILHDGEGFPAWFYLDFPEGSPYESRVMKVYSQPPNHRLHFDLYVSPTSSARDWQMYQ